MEISGREYGEVVVPPKQVPEDEVVALKQVIGLPPGKTGHYQGKLKELRSLRDRLEELLPAFP